MRAYEELFALATSLEKEVNSPAFEEANGALASLDQAALEVARAFSGSWLGYHANVYYDGFASPPAGAHFSQEWGLMDTSMTSLGSTGRWREYDPNLVKQHIRAAAEEPNLEGALEAASVATAAFENAKAEIASILITENEGARDSFLEKLEEKLGELQALDAADIAQVWSPNGPVMTRDTTALGQRMRVPPHAQIRADVAAIRQAFNVCREAAQIARQAGSHLERRGRQARRDARVGTNVFIGHGRSSAWRELKDFVQDRLQLPWDELNRVPIAGVTNIARLSEMLDAAALALVIMTAEDETAEGSVQARMNVVHEVGLFQGRLGFTKAIVLLEEGCAEFPNIQGLGQIRFPAGNIAAAFEEVRQVLEREDLLSNNERSE